MSQKQAPKFCACLANSTSCQGVYVATSSIALVLVAILAVVEHLWDDGGHRINPVVRWDNYIIQDWDKDGKCSEGTRIDDIRYCRKAFDAYKKKCQTRDEGPQVESWDGQPGCHLQDAAFAEFQFNTNLGGRGAHDHAPVCQVGKQQPLQCYEEIDSATELLYIVGQTIVTLLVIVPPIVMSASRLCAPSCCPGGMENVPGCCPCNCFAQLDTPYYVVAGVWLVLFLLTMVVATASTTDLSAFRILRMIPFWLLLAAVVTSIVKLTIMAGCCCQYCKPSAQGAQAAGVSAQQGAQPVVLGEPVVVVGASPGDPPIKETQ